MTPWRCSIFFFISSVHRGRLQPRVSQSVALERRATRWSTCYWQWSIASKSSWAPSVLIRGAESLRADIGKRYRRHHKAISRRYRHPTLSNMPSNPRNHQYLFVPDGENRAARFPLSSPPPPLSANPLEVLKCFTLQNQCRHQDYPPFGPLSIARRTFLPQPLSVNRTIIENAFWYSYRGERERDAHDTMFMHQLCELRETILHFTHEELKLL